MARPRPRSRYKPIELDNAVQDVLGGAKGKTVSASSRIPYNTLMRAVRDARSGVTKVAVRRGPKTVLPPSCENDLVAWIGAMQQDGHPPDRHTVLVKANQMLRAIDPLLSVTPSWYKRFRQRHPVLANRVAQVISHARNSVDMAGVQQLHDSMAATIRDHRLTPDRIFNMDETAFASRRKSTTVIAIKGSQNVWSKTVPPNFHLSIVACVSASGYVFPPTFLFPGDTIDKVLSSECCVPNATITTSPKGFMNEDVFAAWLDHFGTELDSSIPRPILLTFDGLASHYSTKIVELCDRLKIILLCLPSNATHLFQPLDVAVFGPYKTEIRKAIFNEMINDETGDMHSISKAAALRIASSAWAKRVTAINVVSGFHATGLWPLSFEQMQKRFNLFKDGGVPKTYLEAVWIERRASIRSALLTLPARATKKSTRKRIDVGGRILTLALLRDIDQTRKDRQEALRLKRALVGKRQKKKAGLALSAAALKWARLAATRGLMPLPNGQVNPPAHDDEIVVV